MFYHVFYYDCEKGFGAFIFSVVVFGHSNGVGHFTNARNCLEHVSSFRTGVETFTVDLDLPPEQRWAHVVKPKTMQVSTCQRGQET